MLAGHDDAATQARASEPDATERIEASLNEVQPPPASCGPRPLGESVAAESEPAGAMEVEVEVVPSEEDEPTDGVEVVEDSEYEQIVRVGCDQLVLQKSALNATGYLCVVRSERDGLYRVESASYAGISFPTARAAAVAYARIIAAEDESEPELDEDEIARIVQAAEEEVARGDDGCARAREMVRQPDTRRSHSASLSSERAYDVMMQHIASDHRFTVGSLLLRSEVCSTTSAELSRPLA